jgi:hypothetical protein
MAGLHLAVGVQAELFQSLALHLSGGFDPGPDGDRRFGVDRIGESLVLDPRYLDMQIDAVSNGPESLLRYR